MSKSVATWLVLSSVTIAVAGVGILSYTDVIPESYRALTATVVNGIIGVIAGLLIGSYYKAPTIDSQFRSMNVSYLQQAITKMQEAMFNMTKTDDSLLTASSNNTSVIEVVKGRLSVIEAALHVMRDDFMSLKLSQAESRSLSSGFAEAAGLKPALEQLRADFEAGKQAASEADNLTSARLTSFYESLKEIGAAVESLNPVPKSDAEANFMYFAGDCNPAQEDYENMDFHLNSDGVEIRYPIPIGLPQDDVLLAVTSDDRVRVGSHVLNRKQATMLQRCLKQWSKTGNLSVVSLKDQP